MVFNFDVVAVLPYVMSQEPEEQVEKYRMKDEISPFHESDDRTMIYCQHVRVLCNHRPMGGSVENRRIRAEGMQI
jgi:hypothetical protein